SLHFTHSLARRLAQRLCEMKRAGTARKMTRGVLRTTLAALFISVGSWIIIGFFAFIYSFLFTIGISPLTKLQFSATFRLLNVINNVLTPWVLIAAFSKV
ncbi:hypothetical protein PFISCL1PPCAC_4195, partial [Pristionchus fissidentatus]